MNRDELIGVMALSLLVAFTIGWVMRWIYGGLRRINTANMEEVDDLANRLYEMEQAKDFAEQQLKDREWELSNQLGQAEAELAAAMEGLGAARREAEELRARLEG